jgi:hypothetical protein
VERVPVVHRDDFLTAPSSSRSPTTRTDSLVVVATPHFVLPVREDVRLDCAGGPESVPLPGEVVLVHGLARSALYNNRLGIVGDFALGAGRTAVAFSDDLWHVSVGLLNLTRFPSCPRCATPIGARPVCLKCQFGFGDDGGASPLPRPAPDAIPASHDDGPAGPPGPALPCGLVLPVLDQEEDASTAVGGPPSPSTPTPTRHTAARGAGGNHSAMDASSYSAPLCAHSETSSPRPSEPTASACALPAGVPAARCCQCRPRQFTLPRSFTSKT